MSQTLLNLQLAIEPHLVQIERLLPSAYRLTLVCRHTTAGNESDLLLSRDDLSKVQETLAFLQQRDGIQFGPST